MVDMNKNSGETSVAVMRKQEAELVALCKKKIAEKEKNAPPLLHREAPQHGPKCPPWQCPSSPPVPPQGAPGGSGRLGTPGARPSRWESSHRLGGSSESPPKSRRVHRLLTIQAFESHYKNIFGEALAWKIRHDAMGRKGGGLLGRLSCTSLLGKKRGYSSPCPRLRLRRLRLLQHYVLEA